MDIVSQIRAAPIQEAVQHPITLPIRIVDAIKEGDYKVLDELFHAMAAEHAKVWQGLPQAVKDQIKGKYAEDPTLKTVYDLGEMSYGGSIVYEARNRHMDQAETEDPPPFAEVIEKGGWIIDSLLKQACTLDTLAYEPSVKKVTGKSRKVTLSKIQALIDVGAVYEIAAGPLYSITTDAYAFAKGLEKRRAIEKARLNTLQLPDEILEGWAEVSRAIRRVLTSHPQALSANVGTLEEVELKFNRTLQLIARGKPHKG